MKIFELQKEQMESIAFDYIDNQWILRSSDKAKTDLIADFCIDLCIKFGTRTKDDITSNFSEPEVSKLITFFRLHGYSMQRRDSDLEKDLENVYKTITLADTQNTYSAVELLSYNEQMQLMGELAEKTQKTKTMDGF